MGKRSAFENSLVCVAVNGALRGSQNLQKRKANKRKEPSEETQEEIDVCLNCTEKYVPAHVNVCWNTLKGGTNESSCCL